LLRSSRLRLRGYADPYDQIVPNFQPASPVILKLLAKLVLQYVCISLRLDLTCAFNAEIQQAPYEPFELCLGSDVRFSRPLEATAVEVAADGGGTLGYLVQRCLRQMLGGSLDRKEGAANERHR
jgi:hypothetical protein